MAFEPIPHELGLSIAIATGSVAAATLMMSSFDVPSSVFAALLAFAIPAVLISCAALPLRKLHGAYLGAILGYCFTVLSETYWEVFINTSPNSLPGFIAIFVIPPVSLLSLGCFYVALKYFPPHNRTLSAVISCTALGWPTLIVVRHAL
jgi:ABC-type branched-subunit amino acid transport system permease subunit